MYVKINSNIKRVIQKSIEKAGSERELYRILKIPRSLYNYRTFSKTIPLSILKKLIEFLNIRENQIIRKSMLLPHNWRQKIGGVNSYKSKMEKGIFEYNLMKMKKSSSVRMKKIHRDQKRFDREHYHKEQYRRFRKISEYKYHTKRGEKVRNLLEKTVADFLFQNRIKYEYESYVEGKNGVYFPDFIINGKTIIECTMWRGFDKATKLSKKIKDLEKKKFKMIVITTPSVKRFYRKIEPYIVDDLKVLNNRLNLSHSSSD